jgi:hypothetical protein
LSLLWSQIWAEYSVIDYSAEAIDLVLNVSKKKRFLSLSFFSTQIIKYFQLLQLFNIIDCFNHNMNITVKSSLSRV